MRVQHIDDTNGTEIPASVRSGALPAPTALAVASVAGAVPIPILTPQGTEVSLSGDVLFDFDRDRLRPNGRRSLAELSVLIARSQPSGLRIVGHTDNIGALQYNLDLSDRRARNVEHWLLDYGRVQVAALDTEGRGANDPMVPNALPDGRDNRAGRQQNRRVEILLQQ